MAKQHLVKCYFCSEVFNATIEPYVMVNSRRYAHEKCFYGAKAHEEKIKKDKENLEQYIKELFNFI